MIIYKNIGLDNIRRIRREKKREKRINTFGDVGSFDHLDNCKSFGVFNIFKSMFKNRSYHFIAHVNPYCKLLYSGEDFISWKNLCPIPICYIREL
jgi:hypothetical protein